MIKKILGFLFFFIFGAFFWHFISFYIPQKLNDDIFNATSKMFNILQVEDKTQPQFSSIDDLAPNECTHLKESIQIYNNWLKQFGGKISDYQEFLPYTHSIEGDSGFQEGIVKWRNKDNQPYFGLTASGEWEHVLENADIITMSNKAESELISLLKQNGFNIHTPMNIPFYRYPDGMGAKKMGFIKNNSAYLLIMIEMDKGEFSERFQDSGLYDLKKLTKPIAARITCARFDKTEIDRYQQFLDLPHTYPNETVIYVDDLKNNLFRFGLIYPGGSNDYQEHQFVTQKEGRLIILQTTGEFPLCSIFETAKSGKGAICYRPELKEYSIVTY